MTRRRIVVAGCVYERAGSDCGRVAVVVIQVPEILREKLGPDGAKALVDLLNEAAERVRDDVVTLAEERFRRHLAEEIALFRQEVAREFALSRQEMAREIGWLRQGFDELGQGFDGLRQGFDGLHQGFDGLRQEFDGLHQGFDGLRQEFGGEVQSLRQEIANVRVEVATVKSDLTWRLFYFWTAHLVAIAGLLLAFFKLFGS